MSQQTGIDWPRLLGDIAYLLGELQPGSDVLRVPASSYIVADHLHVSRGALRNWIDGGEPRHWEGERLVDAWCVLTGKARGFAPITVRSLSAKRMKERA